MTAYATERSDTASVSIAAPPSFVWQVLSKVTDWPRFSPFALTVSPSDGPDRHRVGTPSGSVTLRTRFDAERLLLDHEVHFADGSSVLIPYRVVSNDAGSELIMTNVKSPGDSPAAYDEQLGWMRTELVQARDWVLRRLADGADRPPAQPAPEPLLPELRTCVAVLLTRWRYPNAPDRVSVHVGEQSVEVCAEHDRVDLWSTTGPTSPVIEAPDRRCGDDCGPISFTVTAASGDRTIRVSAGPAEDLAPDVDHGWVSALTTLLGTVDRTGSWAVRPVMSAPQRSYLLRQLNDHRVPDLTDTTLAAAFERQARRDPDRPALVDEAGTSLSYRELDERADQLAQRLVGHGCRPGSRVAIALARGFAQVTAIYAAAKAGITYVPVDLDQPPGRLRLILDDSRPQVVLTDRATADRLPLGPWSRCVLEDLDHSPVGHETTCSEAATTVAHLLYTSGTTGRPKGVMTTVGSALANLDWMQHRYPYGPGDTAIYKTSFGFDVSIWEIFWPLYHGARLLVTAPDTHRDPGRLAELIARFEVSQLFVVPSVMGPLLDQLSATGPRRLRYLISGGETLPTHLRDRFYARLPDVTLVNAFGPCEAGSVTDAIAPPTADPTHVPVGTPAPNFRLQVLDRVLQPTPQGLSGEAYVGGEIGIGYGYWDNPGGTAERFVADPWGPPGARMYRTGDLCRFAPDGRLVHLGRIDRQLKVRGLRLEPAEVESVLASHPAVENCAVVIDPGSSRLIAFVVTAGPQELPAPELIGFAADLLPPHGVPDEVMYVPALPTTINGKLDVPALLTAQTAVIDDHEVSPTTPGTTVDGVDGSLLALYAEVLGRDQVASTDTFIGLGGHSLLAFQLLEACRTRLGVKPDVTLLLTASVADVAEHIATERSRATAAAIPDPSPTDPKELP